MLYITIDGDDIGQKISACYLSDDVIALQRINGIVQERVISIADILRGRGFEILFCAADGVAGRGEYISDNGAEIYKEIANLVAPDLSFSAGTGGTLREAFIALLYAKSSGKSRICDYKDLK
ncbi:mCpol domain-containing protein [Methylobacterium sp. Leaf113]|uniref:mCpol domain-containing protein n=1 Tax=Methylobacterium sp. Leaf113 TaxID=1736259 RepID=UPI0009EA2560|nr:mCpol domain-containing protein [Methylobacterium sp. Leaf113]